MQRRISVLIENDLSPCLSDRNMEDSPVASQGALVVFTARSDSFRLEPARFPVSELLIRSTQQVNRYTLKEAVMTIDIIAGNPG